jgi:hypothetical protein
MHEILMYNPEMVIVFVFILLMVTALLTPVVIFILQWRQVRQAQLDAAVYRTELDAYLKKDMLNRGMSGAEIKLVLEASASGRSFVATATEDASKRATAADANREDFGKMWADFGKHLAAFGKQWGGCAAWQRRRERYGTSRG